MTKTFRFRLTAWNVGFFALLIVLFCVFLYGVLARSLVARLDDKLTSQANTAAALLEDEIQEEHGDVPKAAAEVVADMRVGGDAVAIFSDGVRLAGEILPYSRRVERTLTFNGHALSVISTESLQTVDADLRLVRRVMLIGLPLFLALAAIGGYLLTRRNLAPLDAMAAQARRITGANLDARLEIGDAAEELGVLAASFNELLSRVDQSFDTMRRFVADASHELRTPLSVIRGEADVSLAHERTAAEYRESLAIILDESRRLSRLVDDLLNLARADAGGVKLQLRDFYFNDLLADCCRSIQSLATTRRIKLDCQPGGDIPFSGDEELLRRLIINLLDNAIRYTPAGGEVTASLDSQERGVRLRISDTGIGIAPDAAAHVFERFFRADKARSRAEGGFGLGLSIVKWIAESHHGAVELDSRPSAGSTFTVTLPQ
jgi:two-component system OmpR family sensor kinase